MPFDAIYIPFGFEGLCPPRLGTGRYAEVSTVLMDLLPFLLPVNSIPRVSATVAAVTMASNNGYNLLFRIMDLSIPGFNLTLPLWRHYGPHLLTSLSSTVLTPFTSEFKGKRASFSTTA